MTKYKLKKDTPLHRAGEIFTKTETTMVASDKYETDTDLIINFDEWFEPVSGKWPQAGKHYYTVRSDGGVTSLEWLEDRFDEGSRAIGNVFKTEKSAHAYVDYLKAITTVRQDEGVMTPEQAAKNGYVYYIRVHDASQLAVHGFDADYVSVNTVPFDTREHAQASLDKHQDEWKIIANYDWSRE